MLRMVRKAAFVLMALAIVFALAGCKDGAGPTVSNTGSTAKADSSSSSSGSSGSLIGVWAGTWAYVDDEDDDSYDDEEAEIFEIIFFTDGTFITNDDSAYDGPISGTYATADGILKLAAEWDYVVYSYSINAGATRLNLKGQYQTINLAKKPSSASVIVNGYD